MQRFSAVASLAAALILAAGMGGSLAATAQDATPSTDGPAAAGAVLYDADGDVVGVAFIGALSGGGSTIGVAAMGLEPGERGVHLHETGACDPAGEKAFSSAGGHYNPTGAEHGGHAGDLGNITVDDEGVGRFEETTEAFTLTAGETGLLDEDGAAIVIHANEDENDPEGKSFGGRIACGVLTTQA